MRTVGPTKGHEDELCPILLQAVRDLLEAVRAVHRPTVEGLHEALAVRRGPDPADSKVHGLLQPQYEGKVLRVEWARQLPQRDRLREDGLKPKVPKDDPGPGGVEPTPLSYDLTLQGDRGVGLEVGELQSSPRRPGSLKAPQYEL